VEAGPRFSPDGKLIAFGWNGPARDNFDIYVKQVGHSGEPLRLTRDTALDLCPEWSPDGGEIAFVRFTGEVTSIYIVPSLGGAERKLYELRAPSVPSYLSWSPDGRWLAFSERGAVESPSRIYLLSLDTRQTIPLTSPSPGTEGDSTPEFSPDGKQVAFVRETSYAVNDVWFQPVPSGEATRFTYGNYGYVSRPAWTADRREVVYAAGTGVWESTNSISLFRIPAAGGVPQPVGGIGENAREPTIWGNRMVFTQFLFGQNKMWRMRGPYYKGKDRSAKPLLVSTREDGGADYSPDGKKIAFGSYRSGFSEIWTCDSEATKLVQLTNLRKSSGTCHWSPDGKRIAFDSRPEEHSEIYVIDPERGIPERLTHEKSDNRVPSWSRDGRWIYFSSNRTGSYQIWKMPSEGGKAAQVTQGGGFYAIEAFEGGTLYYQKPGQRDYASGPLWKVRLEGGEETLVLDREVRCGNWALRPEGIYYSTYQGKKYTIEFLSFQTGEVASVYEDEPSGHLFCLTISPDGEWFIFSENPPAESDLMLVENFR